MISLAYYPGCSQHGTAKEYEMSVRACMKALGVDLVELKDWSCCGSTPAHTVDHSLAAALAARNLRIAKDMNYSRVATPCPSCLSALRNAEVRIQDEEFRKEVNELLDVPFEGGVHALSILQVLFEEIRPEEIAAKAVKSMKGMVAAPYYGCLMNRPPDLMRFDDPENPVAMDNILKALGAEVPDFPVKLECCGASFSVPRKDIVMNLSNRILGVASRLGCNAIVVACPLCQQNLDLRQSQINSANNANYNIPVLYITQVIGLALGLSPEELGLGKLVVSPSGLLSKLGTEGDKS